MKKGVLIFILSFIVTYGKAQTAVELYETGKRFLIQGDADNAVLVLKKAVQAEPENAKYVQELAAAHLYREDYKAAQASVEKLVTLQNLEPYSYYLAYNVAIAQNDNKAAEKYVKTGLKNFENSGLLYNAMGSILGAKGDATAAIQQWEMGIKKEPTYSGNYYEASKYYYFENNLNAKIWAIHYGEMFINIESNTVRTLEVKEVLLNSYKMLASVESFGAKATKNDFETLFMEVFRKAKSNLNSGVTTENLLAMRSVFIHKWFENSATISNSLYERMQQLMREGHFEEYNYWIFEPIQNLAAYENWMKINQEKFTEFMRFHLNKIYKPTGKDYQK